MAIPRLPPVPPGENPGGQGRVIRDMERFNMDSRKYRGVIPPVKTSLRKADFWWRRRKSNPQPV